MNLMITRVRICPKYRRMGWWGHSFGWYAAFRLSDGQPVAQDRDKRRLRRRLRKSGYRPMN